MMARARRSSPTRVGACWGTGPLHQLLTRKTNKGEHTFNRKVWKTRDLNNVPASFFEGHGWQT
jgi:hypothetical protein